MTSNTNEKAFGGESEGSKKLTSNKGDFSPKDAAQLELNLDPERDKQPSTKTKISTILELFLRGRNLNRFDAEQHHDHCLHSTVSSLQNGYGILIDRMNEKVPCLGGRAMVHCRRYWLNTSPDNLTAARALLSMLGRK